MCEAWGEWLEVLTVKFSVVLDQTLVSESVMMLSALWDLLPEKSVCLQCLTDERGQRRTGRHDLEGDSSAQSSFRMDDL